MAWISNNIRQKVDELKDFTLAEIAEQMLDMERKAEDLESELTDLRGELAKAEAANG
jgi:predicted component of type VI protein secretion system